MGRENPYYADLSPSQFEEAIQDIVHRMGANLSDFRTVRRQKISVPDGTFEIDVTARFEALGANFLVLIECKHQRKPVEREVAQVLHDRVRSVGAHKAMLFSTANFQSGAVRYATAHGIALIHVLDGSFNYLTRAHVPGRTKIGAPYAASLATIHTDQPDSGDRVTYRNLDYCKAQAVLDVWAARSADV